MVAGCFGPGKEEVRLRAALDEQGQRHKLQLEELAAARQQQAQTAHKLQQTLLQCELQQVLNSELVQLSDSQAQELNELRVRSARTCEELAAARAKAESLRAAARELEVEHSVHVMELRAAAGEAERRAGEEVQALRQAGQELKAALEGAHRQGAQLQVQLEQRGDRISDLSREVAHLKDARKRLARERDHFAKTLEQLANVVQDLQGKQETMPPSAAISHLRQSSEALQDVLRQSHQYSAQQPKPGGYDHAPDHRATDERDQRGSTLGVYDA